MKQAHENRFIGIGFGFFFGKNIPDDGGAKRVFGNGFLTGAEKLVSCSRRLFEHPHFKEKMNGIFHGII
jgi:hypothetical protein